MCGGGRTCVKVHELETAAVALDPLAVGGKVEVGDRAAVLLALALEAETVGHVVQIPVVRVVVCVLSCRILVSGYLWLWFLVAGG